MSEFKLKLPEIHDLTPRQIEDIYFHDRDADGNIKAPPAGIPADPVAKLTQLLGLAGALKMKPDDVEKLRKRVEAAQRGDQPGQV